MCGLLRICLVCHEKRTRLTKRQNERDNGEAKAATARDIVKTVVEPAVGGFAPFYSSYYTL
jgi:hypothetical protein